MIRRYDVVRSALIDAVIEGLLEMGAPTDEYDPEARMIAQKIADMAVRSESTPLTLEQTSTIVRDVRVEMFGLHDGEDVTRRTAAFEAVARRIVAAEST